MSEKQSLEEALHSDFVYPSKKRFFSAPCILPYLFIFFVYNYYTYILFYFILCLFFSAYLFDDTCTFIFSVISFETGFPCSFILFCFELFLHSSPLLFDTGQLSLITELYCTVLQ